MSPRSAQSGSHPPTIGMLTARLSGPTEINLWHGVADRARQRQVNLICFSGGIPRGRQPFEEQKNILFNFAGEHNVDGLLVWANILSHTLDRPELEAFCQRYAPLPMISMGMVLPSLPSIRIDMRAGMRELLIHLIEEHGRRRIAFIRGPEVSQDAEERYQAYLETLAQAGLPVDPGLVLPGDFGRAAGVEAVQKLASGHSLDFDALVSANDNSAIGALQALQARGIRVPEDVIVAGFDDIEETGAVVPALTTVRTPWHALGSQSVDLLLARINGDPLPEQVLLRTDLITRQSCGCQATPPKPAVPSLLLRSPEKPIPEALVARLIADVQGKSERSGGFISTWLEALSQASSGTQIVERQAELDAIRVGLSRLFPTESEVIKAHELLETAYALTGELAHRRQLVQRLETEDQTLRLNRIVQSMATTFEVDSLMELLAVELPGLGVQSCFISLYEEKGGAPVWSRLILASRGKERLPLERGGTCFPTPQLVPAGLFPKDHPFAYDVEALYFQQQQIGFALFEIGPRDGEVYTALRGHLSSALKSAELFQAALEAENRAIKADQLKTHLLANVSHELRTPINLILGFSQMGLSTPNPYGMELPARLIQDLQHIYDSGEHLVRLINDLLDMSRAEIGELDLSFEPVAPSALLKETFESFKNSLSGKQKALEFCLDIPERLPILQADPVRLRQILMNLLSNAFKFTPRGKIVLGADVQLPHFHFWVADTGTGISPELQERVFEPFVKAEPRGQHLSGIGLGLSITRRLVALHSGSITLESTPGQGSTFHVYLPLPGISSNAAQVPVPEGAQPALLWISSQPDPAPFILNLCQKNGFDACWLNTLEALEQVIHTRQPAALAWDLDNVRPGDWSMVQRIRRVPQYIQLPLLLYKSQSSGAAGQGSRTTNVLLKPVGKGTFQHLLDLLPQAEAQGEIWLVDDDPLALAYYREMLGETLSGYSIRPIQGGKEALRLLKETIPNLVVLDLVMPEVDGFQVLEQMRSSPATAAVPVVILTGKMLSYEDVKRLDYPRVALQTKGILSAAESTAGLERALATLSPAESLPQPTRALVRQAYAYIQQNYGRAFSLQELAATLGVSKSYLSRIVKQDTGISLWNYLNRFRILKAKELLALRDVSVTQIAADVGYEDVGYFTRVFHEIAGCSPRTYKQKIQGQYNPDSV